MGKRISQMRQLRPREVRCLPKVTQQVSDWVGLQIQALWAKHTRFWVLWRVLKLRGSSQKGQEQEIQS